jgi:dienelactone hydrolase
MRAIPAVCVFVVLLVTSVGVGLVRAQGLSRDEFLARYGVANGPADPVADDPAHGARIEAMERFDETGPAADYPYTPSIRAMRDLFRRRAAQAPGPPRSARDVQRAIDETFGVSRLGDGFRLLSRLPVDDALGMTAIDFAFADGGFGQALVGRPPRPNGALLIAIHGCLSSPHDAMRETGSYLHAFGLRAMQQGYTVVAPYVLGACMWMPNADWIGSLSGTSVFGYELAKIAHVARWARREFGTPRVVIWGISLGGQYSMLASALFRDLFDVTIISGAAADYEDSYRASFDAVGLDGRAGMVLGANRQVALSASVSRRDVIASILPRPIVFEVSTAEIDFAPSTIGVIDYVDRVAVAKRAARPEVVLFRGVHETNPAETLKVLGTLLKRQ